MAEIIRHDGSHQVDATIRVMHERPNLPPDCLIGLYLIDPENGCVGCISGKVSEGEYLIQHRFDPKSGKSVSTAKIMGIGRIRDLCLFTEYESAKKMSK